MAQSREPKRQRSGSGGVTHGEMGLRLVGGSAQRAHPEQNELSHAQAGSHADAGHRPQEHPGHAGMYAAGTTAASNGVLDPVCGMTVDPHATPNRRLGDLTGIVRARRLSEATMRNIRQNLFFAFVYNAAGVPVVAGVLYPFFGVLLSPIIAAAAMALSSVSVVQVMRLRPITTSMNASPKSEQDAGGQYERERPGLSPVAE